MVVVLDACRLQPDRQPRVDEAAVEAEGRDAVIREDPEVGVAAEVDADLAVVVVPIGIDVEQVVGPDGQSGTPHRDADAGIGDPLRAEGLVDVPVGSVGVFCTDGIDAKDRAQSCAALGMVLCRS